MRRTVGEPGMPLHGKWLGPGALGRSASIRAGIVWASFGASFKDCMLSAFPSTSKNLTGQEFHGTAYHDPEDKTRRYNKQSYGRCQAWGHDFLGHRFGWGPHRFACLSHPCRVSGPFLINLIVLNSDGIYIHRFSLSHLFLDVETSILKRQLTCKMFGVTSSCSPLLLCFTP